MANEIVCPKCGTVYRLKDEVPAGKMLKCKKCDATFRASSAGVTKASSPDAPPPAGQAQRGLTGQVLGGCRIEEKLGEGGMGIVYKGHHLALDIPVAVKILPPHFVSADATFASRFIREARSAARLHHQNIVGVINVGQERGLHFIVMQYVDGEDLQQKIAREKRIAVDETLRIVIQLCDALAVAAKNHIVHRDIKPENIMIAADGAAKLADLGLAKNVHDQAHVTKSGIGIGTPHYMAPEQAENAKGADHRSDIYSLGCTVYHMLAGKPPYAGTSSIAVLMKHAQEPVANVREANAAVPERLAAAIQRMMEKDPDKRPQTAAEIGRELRAIESGSGAWALSESDAEVEATAGQTAAGRSASAAGRRVAVGGAIAVGVAIVIAIVLIIAGGRDEEPAPKPDPTPEPSLTSGTATESPPSPVADPRETVPPEKEETQPAATLPPRVETQPKAVEQPVTEDPPAQPVAEIEPQPTAQPVPDPEPLPPAEEKGNINVGDWQVSVSGYRNWRPPESVKAVEAKFENGILSLRSAPGKSRTRLQNFGTEIRGDFTVRLEVRDVQAVGIVSPEDKTNPLWAALPSSRRGGETGGEAAEGDWRTVEVTFRRGRFACRLDGKIVKSQSFRPRRLPSRGHLILTVSRQRRTFIRTCDIETEEPPEGAAGPADRGGRRPPPKSGRGKRGRPPRGK